MDIEQLTIQQQVISRYSNVLPDNIQIIMVNNNGNSGNSSNSGNSDINSFDRIINTTISYISVINIKNLKNNEICSICFDEFSDKSIIYELSCGHYFDSHCISEWFIKNKTCPNCRKILFS